MADETTNQAAAEDTAVQAAAETDAAAVTPAQAVNDDTAAIKADIEKLQAAADDLTAKGADLFGEEIKNLEQKIENAEAELAAKTTETVTAAETEVSSWWADHKDDVFNAAKITALVYIAIRLTM